MTLQFKNVLLIKLIMVVSTVFCNAKGFNALSKNFNLISDDKGEYLVMSNGVKLLSRCEYGFLPERKITQIKQLNGRWQSRVDEVFCEVLKYIPSKATMIEVGACWPYYSLWFSYEIEQAKNFVLEPHPDYLRYAVKNFELNQKRGYFYRFYFGNDYEKRITHSFGAIHMQMDWFIIQNDIEHIDVLFVDTQGSELDILTSSNESIEQNKIDYFFIATHSLEKHQSCLKIFSENKYDLITEYPPSASIKDGLIVAKRFGISGPNYIKLD